MANILFITEGKEYEPNFLKKIFNILDKMPDSYFKEKIVKKEDINKYKEICAEESSYNQIDKYDHLIIMSIMIHHLKKVNYILNDTYEIPTNKEYLEFNSVKLYDIQLEKLNKEGLVYVVNTCILNVIYYNPEKLLKIINRQKTKFYI